ncbi:MAG TPA: 2-oxo-4-hydroxy-4-carboxy-5-ureidoimidazoline decarboxylase [Gemmatimonadales bacterium]|nr:2-oxo-4-hydroxy-4-carboxy-5-ureidoimidazoline decarboxylase [Gemmatimonadales bacterium]
MPKALWDWNRVYPTDGIRRLNAFPEDELVTEFMRLCADRRWARGMASVRPFRDAAELLEASDRLVDRLGDVGRTKQQLRQDLGRLLEL